MASALQKFFKKRLSKQHLGKAQKDLSEEAAQQTRNDDVRRESTRGRGEEGELAGQWRHSSSESDPRSSLSMRPVLTVNSLRSARDSTMTLEQQQKQQDRNGRSRSASFGAQAMLRGYSDSSRSSWLGGHATLQSPMPTSSVHVDQFGLLVPDSEGMGLATSSLGHGGTTSGAESAYEEEPAKYDVDDNPLYRRLTQSDSLSRAWSSARLVLLPSKSNAGDLPLEESTYVGLHALVPSHLFKDQYVSTLSNTESGAFNMRGQDDNGSTTGSEWDQYTITVTLEPESQSIHWLISSLSHTQKTTAYEQTLRVANETTVYRTVEKGRGAGSSKKKERIKVRIITVDGPVVPGHLSSKSSTIDASPSEPADEGSNSEVTAIAFPSREPSMNPLKSSTAPASDGSPPSSSHLTHDLTLLSSRHFFADLDYLLDPSSSFAGPFAEALRFVTRATAEFTNAYVYVPGFDAYNVSRIRRGILAKAWLGFESTCRAQGQKESEKNGPAEGLERLFNPEDRSKLLLLFENVVMGYCHGKIYGSIRAFQWQADDAFDGIVATYHDCDVTTQDLQVQVDGIQNRPELFDHAVGLLSCLGDAEEDFDYLLSFPDHLRIRAFAERGRLPVCSDTLTGVPQSAYQQCSRVRMRTPQDALGVLKATIEEIGAVAERAQAHGRSRTAMVSTVARNTNLSMDELLPLLSYVVIRAAPRRLRSLLYYIRAFGISEATPSELNWALINTEAVVEYLRTDPLRLCIENSIDTLVSSPKAECASPSERGRPRSIHLPSRGSEKDLFSLRNQPTELARTTSDGPFSINRQRRSSLPSNVVLSTSMTESHEGALALKTDDLPRSRTPSSSTSPVSASAGFKVPGRPASANVPLYEDARRRGSTSRISTMTSPALDRVGEDSLSTETAMTSPALSSSSALGGGGGMHRRTSSSSATGDLSIRTQIVVRPRRQVAHSTSSSDRPMSPSSPHESLHAHQRPQPRVVGSRATTIEGADLEERQATASVAEAKAKMDRPTIDDRRKSIDSWMSLSNILGTPLRSNETSETEARSQSLRLSAAASKRPQTTRSLTGVNSPSQTPSLSATNMSESGSTGTLASASLSWLPLWPADTWDHRKSFATDSASSRPPSIGSIEGLFPASQSGSGFATIPSSASSHGMAHSPESIVKNRTLKATASIRSNSSQSSGSHGAEHDASAVPERRRRRSRLLSNSSHSALVPPQLVASQGASPFFVGSSSAVFSSNPRTDAGESLAAAVGRSTSPRCSPMSTPTTQDGPASHGVKRDEHMDSSVVSPPTVGFGRTLSLPHLSSPNYHAGGLSAESYFPPLFRIQVPSPVAEVSDPLLTHAPRQLQKQQQQRTDISPSCSTENISGSGKAELAAAFAHS